MISLAGSLPLEWPASLQTMFEAFDVISSAGTNLLIPDCELTHLPAAEAVYLKQSFFACMVPLVALVCLCGWLGVWASTQRAACRCRKRCGGAPMSWARVKDVTVLSIVLLLFLLYPLLSKMCLALLKCAKIGDEGYFLLADLEEPCYEGRHSLYVGALAVPQIILVVIGLPLAATFKILRAGSTKLRESPRLRTRFGLLYVGYVEKREWWEMLIVCRKIGMVLISVFGSIVGSVELQACVSQLILFFAIIAHLLGQPFGLATKKAWRLHVMELMALAVVWIINWVGLVLYLGRTVMSRGVAMLLTVFVMTSMTLYLIGAVAILLHNRRDVKRQKRESMAAGTAAAVVVPVTTSSPDDDAANDGEDRADNTAPKPTSIVPSPNTTLFDTTQRPGAAIARSRSVIRHAETLQSEHDEHERRLRLKHEQGAERSRRHTEQRLRARLLLRRTKTLQKAEVFNDLDSEAIDAILEAMNYVTCTTGEEVVAQGSLADAFFVIVRGECGVFRCNDDEIQRSTGEEEAHASAEDGDKAGTVGNMGMKVSVLRALDIFGENALLPDRRFRNATVIAESESSVQLLKLSGAAFDSLMASGRLGEGVLEKVRRVSERRHQSNVSLGLVAAKGARTGIK